MEIDVGWETELAFEVSEAVYEGFQATFRDRNPLHTDAAFARARGFADRVMYGNLLNGFVSYFVGEGLPSRDVIIHKQAIRFRKPVYLGDRLTMAAKLVERSEAVGAYEFAFTFTNQGGEKVANGMVQVGLLRQA